MAPTLVTSYSVSTGNAESTSTLTTPSFTPAVGEIIVCKVGAQDLNQPTIGTLSSSAGGLTFTQRDNVASADVAPVRLSTAPVTTSTAMTISCTFSGAAGRHFLVVERWSGAQLDATPNLVSTKTGSGAPSTTLTTEAAGSIVTWVDVDYDFASGSRTYRSSATEVRWEQPTGGYSWYCAYQSAASAGAQTLGMTSPSGQTWSLIGLELQDSGSGGVSGVGTRTNLAPNPALKVDATGWSAVSASGWGRSTSVAGGLPRTTGFEGSTGPLDVLAPRAAVVAGQSYYWAVWVSALVDLNAEMLVNYYDAASGGTFVGNSGSTVPLTLTAGNTSRFIVGPHTAPAGAVSGQLKLTNLAGACEITGYQVELASTFGIYFDGDTPGGSWNGSSGNSTSTIRASADTVTVGESFSKTATSVGPVFNDSATIGQSLAVTAASTFLDLAAVVDGFLISALEWDARKGRNRVSAFTFGSDVVQARVMRRRVNGGAWELVRGGTVAVVAGHMVRPVDDYEFPSGIDLDYRVQGVDASGTVVQSATVRRRSAVDSVWLKFITQPSLNQALTFMGRSEITRQARTSVFDVLGRPDPVVVSDVHSSRRMTITCKAETPAEASTLDYALSRGLPCYLQVPETLNTPSMYAVINDYRHEAPAKRSMRSVFTIGLIEVAAPSMTIVSPGETWARVIDQYPTWEALMSAAPRWLDIAD